MANIQRLIRLSLYFVVGLLLGSAAVFAHAETQTAVYQETIVDPVQTASRAEAGIFYTTALMPLSQAKTTAEGYAAQVCGANARNWGGPWTYTMMAANAQQWQRSYGCGAATSGNFARANTNGACPAGSAYNSTMGCVVSAWVCPDSTWTLDATTHMCSRPTQCPTGYHVRTPDNGTCEINCVGDQVQDSTGKCTCSIGSGKEWISFSGSYSSTVGCANGCQYNLGGMAIGIAGGNSYTRGTRNGSICGANTTLTPAPKLVEKAALPPADTSGTSKDGATPDPKNTKTNASDPEACAGAGGSYGTYNGVGKCLTPDANTPMVVKKPSGSTTTNSDGSKSETVGETTTTCTGSSCTTSSSTTTTTTGTDGTTKSSTTTGTGSGSSGTGNGNADKDFCADHPNSIICKTSSWSGDCEEPPVCDGDAVACATAKAVWEHRCVNKWAEKENPLSTEVKQDKLFGDQAKADEALNKDGAKDWDVLAKFQEKRANYLQFASSCAPNLGFDFKGVHYDFDTSILCQIGLVVKILLHLAAYMALIRLLTVKLF